jgi:hypothetical protein
MRSSEQSVQLYSWDALDPTPLRRERPVSAAFLEIGPRDFRSAARLISSLPYGRNANPEHPLAVLTEGRGTCSTKHALLRRLAIEQGLDAALVLGIFEMTERNTPGVGKVLAKYGLTVMLEAHCYLRSGGHRVDVTRKVERKPVEAMSMFLHEGDIDPDQIGSYKISLHKKMLAAWATDQRVHGLGLEELWRIREE